MEGPTLFIAPSKSAWLTGRASSISISIPSLPPASHKAACQAVCVIVVTELSVTTASEVAAPVRQLLAYEYFV
jgi:hypothetical protein